MTKLPKPFPSLRRLIPSIYAFWNAVKGGSDTTTKLMDDCLLQIPKCHMNTETVAISRCISLVLVLNHRLMQVTSSTVNPNVYPSLCHYRHAASARLTYHKTLLRHWRLFTDSSSHRRITTIASPPALHSTPPTQGQQQVRRGLRSEMVDGVIPINITFGANLSTKTPQRHGALIRSNTASAEVQSMVRYCTGRMHQVYPCK
eukprot:CAMPEP_0197242346 /NCGR_PEP_ID=MMETSP1429-20130617/8125_1 /TAXON_ID=49237 /ORGANISM="Chaetoceros  sp., Strain UNC1202" /LENGTH=201 /DNA_ID=CAMNT_0042702357 /DNA_START=72 /DNA_END=674 /DNA_ORIENTATION=-